MTAVLIVLVALAAWYKWLARPEPKPDVDSYDDITALAEAAGVMRHPSQAWFREELRIEALAYHEAQRDLADESIAAWLDGAR